AISIEITLTKTTLATAYFIENFKDKINHYLLQLKQQKDEEPQKNILRDLLRDIFKYDCNARGKIDLAIFEDSKVKVIFECKALSNKNEFIAGGGETNFRR
ncbi:MAG: hypothetical protein K2N45_03340, partial [Helicobacter japonicus]|nr:hypothetical protein [Helicobacter japonicus]